MFKKTNRLVTRSLLILAAFPFFAACTRQATEKPLTDAASVVVTPNLRDTRLPVGPSVQGAFTAPHLAFSGQAYSTTQYLRLVDDLRALGHVDSDDGLSALAGGLYRGFYGNQANFTHTTFARGPIPSAVVGEGEAPIREAVTSLEADLRGAVNGLNGLLVNSTKSYPWPRTLPHFAAALDVTDAYVAWLDGAVQGLGITGVLKAAAQEQLKEQYAKYRASLVSLAGGLDGAQHMAQALTALEGGLKTLGLSLPAADAAKLTQADVLARQLAAMKTSQDALGILITVWTMTAPADRAPTFQKVSPELYDFLATKNDEELACLAHPHCPNPALGIAKLMIFPKLEAYGLTKLRDQVDASARDSILESTREQVLKTLPTLPLFVRDAVNTQTAPYFSVIAKIKGDVLGFARDHVQKWTASHLTGSLRGLETASVVVSLRSRDSIEVKPAVAVGSVVATGADTIGASLALSQAFLPAAADDTSMTGMLLEPIMKLLAVGGFRQPGGKPFPGFLLPIDGGPGQVFQLENLMKETTTFAVPDSFQANDLFQMDRVHARRNVGAGAQAELLKGISRQIAFYRDWEQNQYDVTLGRILVEDIVPEIPKGLIHTSFLPKEVLFTMGLANAGALLENLILNLSPGFLVLDKGSILWGNAYQQIKGNKVSTVAGLVSLVDGKRDGIVRTADVARYVLALDEFMAATDGMENSTASALQAKTNDGKSTLLADLLDIRKKLLLLQMGLSNYLVYVAQQPDGSLASEMRVSDHLEKTTSARRLEDQALAIRALLVSAKRLDLPLFRWSALDVYFGLNRNFFDVNRQFYAGEIGPDGKPSRAAALNEIVLTLLSGEELADVMPSDTRVQWSQVAKPWVKALQDL